MKKIFAAIMVLFTLFLFTACGKKTKSDEGVPSGTRFEHRIQFTVAGEEYILLEYESVALSGLKDAITTEGSLMFFVSDYKGFALLGDKAYDIKSDPKELSVNTGDVVVDTDGHILIVYGSGNLKGEIIGRLNNPDPDFQKAALNEPEKNYVDINSIITPLQAG